MQMREPPASLFVGRTPPSVVPLTFSDEGNLTEICSKFVRRLEAELHTHLPAEPISLW